MSTDQRIDHGQFADTPRSEAVGSRSTAVGMRAAAVALIAIGLFHLLQGIAALVKSSIFVVGDSWMVKLDVATWGWIHITLGVLVGAGGLFLLTKTIAARLFAVAILAVSALANLVWMPYYPVLSVLVIVIEVYVIWALTAHRDILPAEEDED